MGEGGGCVKRPNGEGGRDRRARLVGLESCFPLCEFPSAGHARILRLYGWNGGMVSGWQGPDDFILAPCF